MTTEAVLARCQSVRATGPATWTARCPAHDDASNDTLGIRTAADQRTLLYCRAGCDTGAVLAALDLTYADLFDGPSAGPAPLRLVPPTFEQIVLDMLRHRARRYDRWMAFWDSSLVIARERRLAARCRALAASHDLDSETGWTLRAVAALLETAALNAEAEDDAGFDRRR